MKEILNQYAQYIAGDSEENLLKVYSELAEIFKKEELYHLQSKCIEAIWNITYEPDLLKKSGDIFLYNLDNPSHALKFYVQYLQLKNLDFYKDFMTALNREGYENFTPSIEKFAKTTELKKLANKFCAIIFMMELLHKHKDYQGILEFKEYLNIVNKKARHIYETDTNTKEEDYSGVLEANIELSFLISSTIMDFELNKFAIKLYPKNERAYLNVVEAFIENNEINNALDFYNNTYAKEFEEETKESIVDIYWLLSNNYYDRSEYFNSIKYQKKAIDTELEKEES